MSLKNFFNLHAIMKKKDVSRVVPESTEVIAKQENIPEETEYEIVEKEILPEKMICPDCGGITLVGLDFCDKCGGELINNDC